MSDTGAIPPPPGFSIGHWTDREGATGVTVVLPPSECRCGVDVRGGGPGTRETDVLAPHAFAEEATAVVLAGGSAFGLAAADGVARWCEANGRGYRTPGGRVPLVPAAVVYDLVRGRADARPDSDAGWAAAETARAEVPERGRVGAGTGAAVGKLLGSERASPGGVGYAALRVEVLDEAATVAAIAVVNAFGDVLDEDGAPLAAPRGEDGGLLRTTDLLLSGGRPAADLPASRENTTLVCVITDAGLTKSACGTVARMATAGIARAVDPVFSPVDGDVAFCLAAGGVGGTGSREAALVLGTAAGTVTAAAVRDGVRRGALDAAG